MDEDSEDASPELGAPAAVGRILRIVRDRGPLAASEIVRFAGLAKSTVSINLDRLLEAGLVREVTRAGSKRRKLEIAESAGYVLGVDLGQTHLSVGLCNLRAQLLERTQVPLLLRHETPEAVLDRTTALAGELLARAQLEPRRLLGVAMGVPGPVDYARGVPVSPPVMPGWDHFPVASHLTERFGCPAFLDNDVNLMALGERDRGAAQDADDFMFVKIGTGIGCGLVVRGEIYRGARGAAGDIGHIGLDGDATVCRCGNRGCLEAVAGGEGLQALAEAAARDGRSVFLARRAERGEALDPAALALGATSGDELCNAVLMESGRRVGDVLAKLVNFFNPSLIVVGGGVALVGERYIASIREAVYRRSTPLATSDLVVKKAILGQYGGVIGAAVLVLDEILSHRNLSKLVGRGEPEPRAERPRPARRTWPRRQARGRAARTARAR
jgi:glucokinase-like ROK family protein